MFKGCPFCRHTPFLSDLRKIYHDETVCKICNENRDEQFVGPCGHVICVHCIDNINVSSKPSSSVAVNEIQAPLKLYKCLECDVVADKFMFSRRQRRLGGPTCKACAYFTLR